jgi:hypothetical protein
MLSTTVFFHPDLTLATSTFMYQIAKGDLHLQTRSHSHRLAYANNDECWQLNDPSAKTFYLHMTAKAI